MNQKPQTSSAFPGARLIAFYLPQYHPIPENDEWWGKGFTEWTVVTRARPLFRGHEQPRLPADLGFYDLRVPEVREAQAALAREHGIEGFCYWHYWLGGGRQLLERPLNEVLDSGVPDFPFCLGWANHSWKGVCFGAGNRLLVEQTYPGEEDHRQHFAWLLRAFRDPRYIRVDGKPVLHIHRPVDIPAVRCLTDLWRKLAVQAGLKGLHLVGGDLKPRKLEEWGFDATVFARHRRVEDVWPASPAVRRAWRLWRRVLRRPAVFSYRRAMKYFLSGPENEMWVHPCLVPNWDTTPRLGLQGVVLRGATPELFRAHVQMVLSRVQNKPAQHRLVFLRSWNEWAEGNYVEPDQRVGRGYLAVLKDEVMGGGAQR